MEALLLEEQLVPAIAAQTARPNHSMAAAAGRERRGLARADRLPQEGTAAMGCHLRFQDRQSPVVGAEQVILRTEMAVLALAVEGLLAAEMAEPTRGVAEGLAILRVQAAPA